MNFCDTMRVVVMRIASYLLCAALGVAAWAAPAPAQANGRFPSSSYVVVGPGPGSSSIALRATFGLVTSQDGGRTWAWTCEEAFGAVGMFDASMAIGFDGTIVTGTPLGLQITRSGCSWGAPRGSPMQAYVDISNDRTGRYLVSAIGPTGTDDTIVVSSDGGSTWTTGARIPGLYTETIEVAPSDPMRIYMSGYLRGGVPILLRSDDGGMTVREATRDFGRGTSAYISGVDPTNPDVVYIRSSIGFGTILLRSSDGGRSFREIAATASTMVGFALSDDGGTVWVGSSDRAEGILRSERGGPFRRVAATVTVRCLRAHGGVLYVCTDEVADGYMLGCSFDGGDRIDPLFSGRALMGVSPRCDSTTQVGMVCSSLWPAQRMTLTSIDAGPIPTPVTHDATVPLDVVDEPRADAGSDVAATDITDIAAEAATDAPAEATADIALPDVVADVLPPDAAPPPDVLSPDATAPDVTPAMDATMDVAVGDDAPADVEGDRGADGARESSTLPPPPMGGGCTCRAATARGGGGAFWGVALGLLELSRRRRTRRRRVGECVREG